ncbi:MAG: FTR1 family iron permease [Nitrospirae bacterium]|nr:FTR1 family iron permease [Nitrospirota bacterium]
MFKIFKKMHMKVFAPAIVLFIFLIFLPAHAAEKSWNVVVDEIEELLKDGKEAYAHGRSDEAKRFVSDAYFTAFEGEGMETAINIYISGERVYKLETMFGGIRKTISVRAPLPVVVGEMDSLISALREDAVRLPERGGAEGRQNESHYVSFINSFVIILREGFEAILVISALTAYLAKTGQKDNIRTVYLGGAAALVASLLTAVLLQTVIKISGAGKEAMEGVTMLFATAILFYVSYWLISKMEAARWQRYIQSKVSGSISRGNVIALGFAAFLAVYREGAETILFYQALYSSTAASGAVTLGLAAGILPLIAIFFLIKYGSVRIPVAPFFAVTSALLYYLAFSFAGKGVFELQAAEWISATHIKGFPTISPLGIFPSWEGIALQSILVIALGAALLYTFVLRPDPERRGVSKDFKRGIGS